MHVAANFSVGNNTSDTRVSAFKTELMQKGIVVNEINFNRNPFCKSNFVEFYRMADVFAFPSKREGLGLAALEAMASGLPIITSNIHGNVDYSINNETGYSCRPEDIDGFAAAIENLRENASLRTSMGKNAILVKKYDLKNVKLKMGNIYK